MTTIAKALKIKNRVAEKLRKAEAEMRRVNSYRLDLGVDNDPAEVWKTLTSLREELWRLKSSIAKANLPVQDAIFEMAELKAEIAFLNSVPSTSGKQAVTGNRYSYSDEGAVIVEYTAHLDRNAIEKLVEEKQQRLDDLQEQLDYFNNSTKVDVNVLGK